MCLLIYLKWKDVREHVNDGCPLKCARKKRIAIDKLHATGFLRCDGTRLRGRRKHRNCKPVAVRVELDAHGVSHTAKYGRKENDLVRVQRDGGVMMVR